MNHNTITIHNNNIILLEKIHLLPEVIIQIIHEYIPLYILVFVTKEFYMNYHPNLYKYHRIPRDTYDSYIKDMVRKDCHFIFEQLVRENYNKWTSTTKYNYKNIVYANYNYFLKHYCMQHNATNCKNILDSFFNDSGLSKNQHKKNTHKSIRWKT